MRYGKEWKHEYMSANNEHHIPLHVKPVQSKKGGVTYAKVIIIFNTTNWREFLPRDY
mgnify:CR=1 FL=1